ncbi:Eukaryotic translation initiation factor 3 subunit G [Hanseniaspora osmophila]|uniref:Eukaryotic translation initiation factor 3 subunit G n=1 Tax=Hanseniaspora osmophila TaxID=56408 RepID=A0A1E5R024_9ASCO|nr:Eukaryotic translation initiation factor 3 subunit G [Hanseniaspora osmophila]
MSAVANAPVDFEKQEIIKNDDGTKTIISYKLEKGVKYKITQKVKEVKIIEKTNPAIEERKKWAKYGVAVSDTKDLLTVGDDVPFFLGVNWKEMQEQYENKKNKKTVKSFVCSNCGGAHLSAQCPFPKKSSATAAASAASGAGAVPASTGKYVPPSKRALLAANAKAAASGEAILTQEEMRKKEEDERTLVFADLNLNTTEDDLTREVLKYFQYERCRLVRDRNTGRSRGLAYVSFYTKEEAERAANYWNNKGYMNIMMRVRFVQEHRQNR